MVLTSIYVRIPVALSLDQLSTLRKLSVRHVSVVSGSKEYHAIIGKRWVAFLKKEQKVVETHREEIEFGKEIDPVPLFRGNCHEVDMVVFEVSEIKAEVSFYCYEVFYGGVLLAIIDTSEPYEIEETILRLLAENVPEFVHRAVLRPM